MKTRGNENKLTLTIRLSEVFKFDFKKDMNSKSPKFGILLLLIYIIYLALGAAMFMVLESPNEVK